MRAGLIRTCVCVASIVVGWPASADTPVTAQVMSSGALAPVDIVVRAFVEPDTRNRYVEFTVSSDDFYRRSVDELQGDKAPRLSEVRYRNMPRGLYTVQVIVVGVNGVRGHVERSVQVW
jgi:hypothetical protein